AITPDGPRGPIYDLKAGALLAARRTGSAILLMGIEYRKAWRLKSWDRFCIPVPFSRARVRFELVSPEQLDAHREDLARWLRGRLMELNGEREQSAEAAG
ncbi:MAG: hypothetical protein D6781_11760, partial [Verrucomicrobia bacterium]